MPPAPEENNSQEDKKDIENIEDNPVSPVEQPSPPPSSKRSRVIKWLVAIAAVALIAVAAFLVIGQPDKKSEPEQAQKKDIPLLRIGYTSGPLNSFYPGGYSYTSNFLEVNFQTFEGLVRYEEKTKLVPALATGWSNPDSSTWVFSIRPDVKFHTGRTMTADDVKASLEAAKSNPDLDLYSSTIKSVETTGSDKVTITTDGTDPILLNKLNYLFIFDTKSDKTDDPINGTGPYVLKSGTEPEEAKISLTAYDDYYQGRPSTRELELSWYEDQQVAVDDFNNGKLDITGFLDTGFVEKLNKYEPYLPTPLGTRFIRIQTANENSPLAKKEFRQGLQYLLDKPALIKVGGAGLPASQIVPQDIPGHDSSIKEPGKDVTKAKALFTAAGYPNGATLSLISSSSPDPVKEIQRQFAEGGIKIESEDIPDFDAFLAKSESGEVDLTYQAYVSDFLDGTDFLSYLTKDDSYKNTEIDKLVEESNQALDSADRLVKLKQASRLAADDVPVLPLSYLQDTFAMNNTYVLQQDITSSLSGSYFWKTYQK